MYLYGKRCVHIFFIELNPRATCTGGVTVHYTSFPIPVEDLAVQYTRYTNIQVEG